ncbi:hypothetical protein RB213_005450 [Colletotrichum asianum]
MATAVCCASCEQRSGDPESSPTRPRLSNPAKPSHAAAFIQLRPALLPSLSLLPLPALPPSFAFLGKQVQQADHQIWSA